MGVPVKVVRIYAEDWERLNRLMSLLVYKRGKRMSFADVVKEIIDIAEDQIEEAVLGGVHKGP